MKKVGQFVLGLLTGCATDAKKRTDEINAPLKEDSLVMEKCSADFEKRDNTLYIRQYVLDKPDKKMKIIPDQNCLYTRLTKN